MRERVCLEGDERKGAANPGCPQASVGQKHTVFGAGRWLSVTTFGSALTILINWRLQETINGGLLSWTGAQCAIALNHCDRYRDVRCRVLRTSRKSRRVNRFFCWGERSFPTLRSVIAGVHCFQPQLEKSTWKVEVKMGIAVLPQNMFFLNEAPGRF